MCTRAFACVCVFSLWVLPPSRTGCRKDDDHEYRQINFGSEYSLFSDAKAKAVNRRQRNWRNFHRWYFQASRLKAMSAVKPRSCISYKFDPSCRIICLSVTLPICSSRVWGRVLGLRYKHRNIKGLIMGRALARSRGLPRSRHGC